MPVCVYWDESAQSKLGSIYKLVTIIMLMTSCDIIPGGRGDWSTEGCEVVGEKYQDRVICECDHLSTFGVFVVRILIDQLDYTAEHIYLHL